MTSPILVTGGTGTLGRHVVPLLREAGRDVRVLSRHGRESGRRRRVRGRRPAQGRGNRGRAGRASRPSCTWRAAPRATTRRPGTWCEAASRAGVRHLVYISVIGADRVPLGWFGSKLAAERAVAESGLPWTTLRAAQFHDLVLTMVQKMAKLPVIPVPGGLRFQPVDSREVAARLVELTLGAAGRPGARPGRADRCTGWPS